MRLTRQQRLNLSFFIGKWSTCQDKDNHWTSDFFAGIWRKYGVRP